MKNKRNLLYALALVLVGAIFFMVQAQQKKDAGRVSFSGEWKAKKSISMGGNIVCCFNPGDRMLAETMKITEQPNFLTVEVSSSFAGEAPVSGQEKLTFDGDAGRIDHGQGRGKKFNAQLSADKRTLTVNSIVYLMIDKKQEFFNIAEVWKLSDDGKSISVHTKAKSTSSPFGKERSWTTVFDKAS